MHRTLLLLPAVFLFGYGAFLTAPAQTGSGQSSTKASGEIPAHVKTIYKADCGICHGDNGNGKTDLATGMGLTFRISPIPAPCREGPIRTSFS